jgi:hypothetical protein
MQTAGPPRPRVARTTPWGTAWLDGTGIAVSVACAVHCVASTAFLAALAALGLSDTMPDWIEWAFLAASLLIGTAALRGGHKAHGHALPLRLFALGIAIILLARVTGLSSSPAEPIVVVAGALSIVVAHALNWRHGRSCRSVRVIGDPSAAS